MTGHALFTLPTTLMIFLFIGPSGTNICSNAQLVVEPWFTGAQGATWASLTPSSQASYRSKIWEFTSFCRDAELALSTSSPPEAVMRFLLALRTVTYLSGPCQFV